MRLFRTNLVRKIKAGAKNILEITLLVDDFSFGRTFLLRLILAALVLILLMGWLKVA